ncbi:MAG TPA: lysophospholipid acyltransferase family protein [Hyphomonas sp.]|nr:lysophospholipid acyltransferase family protein [Hyphomonas sp.]
MNDQTPAEYVRPKDIDNRASFWQRVQWRLETIAWDLIYWGPMKALGPDKASDFGGWLMRKIGPLLSQHKTMKRNLRLAFPGWDAAKVDETALAAWDSAGRTAGEMPHLPEIDPYTSGRVEIVGLDVLDAVRDSGKGAVFISGHFANWEIMPAAITQRIPRAVMTYRALNNPHIDKRIADLRAAYGTQVNAPKGIGTRELMRALSKGSPVALMNDQKFNGGISVPFFGHEAMTAPGPTRLALKYQVPIVPVSTTRTGPARFRIEFHTPFVPEDTGNTDEDILRTVKQINAFLEAQVRAYPGQWFWQHRRWPKEAWKAAGV